MALTVADIGAEAGLKIQFNNIRATGGNNLTLKLFTSDTTPADTDTQATYTEANGGGYAAKTLTMGSWTVNITSNIAQAAYGEQTWTFTGALTGNPTIYGYYIVDADNVLQWAERLGATFTPTTNGDILRVTPIYKRSKGTPT
jgi:hypothetical protein